MADHKPTGPVELGAEMDYAEHNRTFAMFIALTKWSIVFLVALLVAMAFGLVGPGGFFSSLVVFVIVCAAGYFALR
ncbi:MAG TPA: aa3-type cytochrome c oxidase subunit IV [Rhizobiaceae bacterium]|nr:aa3-type cytochrome c oxidase subunit IV [Rhizobiaceae bacterium]